MLPESPHLTQYTDFGLAQPVLKALEERWREPDQGIWEVRGSKRHFTFSKIAAWLAFDRCIKSAEQFGLDACPIESWRTIRQEIHDDVCRHGWNEEVGAFVQSYGDTALDASLLLVVRFGFLPRGDPRLRATIEAIERDLVVGGLVRRYHTGETDDGLECPEGAFVACSFWLCDALIAIGRFEDARALFERLLALRNDVGLLSEEYDPEARRQLGNTPQAFSHVALVNTGHRLAAALQGAAERD